MGANSNTTGGLFRSALDAAEHAGHTNIQTILKRAGAVSTAVLETRIDYTQALAAVGVSRTTIDGGKKSKQIQN